MSSSVLFFCFKQKTAYEMRISDWSSDVCSSDLYGLFDDAALQRLCFVRAAFEAGIGLDALARLCRALDAADGDEAAAQLAVLRQFVERRREALADLEVQLATMPTEPAQHAESLP